MKLSRRRKAEAPYCPNCLSLLESADNLGGWLSSKTYQCKNPECNYRGSFYVTKDEEEEEIEEDSINSE